LYTAIESSHTHIKQFKKFHMIDGSISMYKLGSADSRVSSKTGVNRIYTSLINVRAKEIIYESWSRNQMTVKKLYMAWTRDDNSSPPLPPVMRKMKMSQNG
jgi:hypothetical protein